MDKSILDLATRSFSPEVRSLLVHLLNEANDQVREAYKSDFGKQFLITGPDTVRPWFTAPFTSNAEVKEDETKIEDTLKTSQKRKAVESLEANVYQDIEDASSEVEDFGEGSSKKTSNIERV